MGCGECGTVLGKFSVSQSVSEDCDTRGSRKNDRNKFASGEESVVIVTVTECAIVVMHHRSDQMS